MCVSTKKRYANKIKFSLAGKTLSVERAVINGFAIALKSHRMQRDARFGVECFAEFSTIYLSDVYIIFMCILTFNSMRFYPKRSFLSCKIMCLF